MEDEAIMGRGEGRGAGVRPRRMGPAEERTSMDGSGSDEGRPRKGRRGLEEEEAGAGGGPDMGSSTAGGGSMGRDIEATVRLITCGGRECQAVSQRSGPHSTRSVSPLATYGQGREEDREREEEGEGKER